MYAGGDNIHRRSRHENVRGYYDNNKQYHYAIVDHVPEHPDISVSSGSGARSTAFRRRPLSRHRYHSGATATTFPEEEMDMSYEV